MIRFLHTADWQIGKPFGSCPPDERGELRAERFAAVARIAALAAERACDAVLVAGDAFDDNMVSDRELNRTLEAMAGFAGPWVMLPGNHDAALSVSVWTRLASVKPAARLVIADRPEPILLCQGRLAILPAPLTRRHEGADLTTWFDGAETPAGAVRVGLAHGSVTGRLPEKAESGNPIAENRADRARLDYLALGDWHGFLEIAPRTVYSGTPEPDRYRANEPGHVAIVEVDAPGAAPRVEKIRVGRFRWRCLDLRLDGDPAELEHALGELDAPGETLLDLCLSGSLPLRGRLALEERLAHWRSRLFLLRVRDAALFDAPDEDDLDRIDLAGFVRVAVERLRAKAADPADPEREAAALALRTAYVEHRRLEFGRSVTAMELTRLAVRDFAGIDAADLSFAPGLNVVVGDNEAGKSTLLAALRAAFFQKHRATGESMKALAPYGRQARPEIEVGFRLGGADYALTKAFLQRPEARLDWDDGRLAGDAVEEHLAELLRFAHPGRGESKLGEHQGAFGLLWVEQGRASEGLDLGVGRHAVTASLEGEIGQILGGERGRQLLNAAKALQDRFFTETLRPKLNSPLKIAEDALAALRAELGEREAARRDYEARIERLADRRARLAAYEAEDARASAEGALARARQASQRLDSVRQELTGAERSLEHAHAAWERAGERLERRRRLREEEAEARRAADVAAAAFAELRARAGPVGEEREAADEALRTARAAEEEAERIEASRARIEDRFRLERDGSRLKEDLERAREIEARLQALGGESVASITRAALEALEAAARARLEAEIRLSAAAPIIVFAPGEGQSIRDNAGRDIAAGVFVRVAEAQEFLLEGFGAVRVRPGGGADDLAGAAREAAGEEQRLLDACRADSVDAARRIHAQGNERERERMRLSADLKRVAPDGLPALTERVDQIARRVATFDPAEAVPPEDGEALRARRYRLREERQRLEVKRDTARGAQEAFEKAMVRAEAEGGHRASLSASLAAELAAAEAERAEAALEEDVAAAEVERRACQAVLSVRRRELDAADPEAVRLELSRAETALLHLDRSLAELLRETSTLEGELRMQGAVSLGEEVERLGGEIDAAEERVRRLRLEADAARLLHGSLVEAQRQARDHWLAPIKGSISPYLRLIQPGTDVELDDTTLEIRGLQRSGREEEFRRLSRGAREQVAVLTRLALAEVLKRGGHPATVILDDALVNTDEKRLARMHLVLRKAAESLQIIVLTCRERDFRDLGAPISRL